MENIAQIATFLRQGRFNHLLSILNEVDHSSNAYDLAILWQVKCLFEQGKIGQAASIIDQQLPSIQEEVIREELFLHYLFIGLFQDRQENVSTELITYCKAIQKANPNKRLQNLAKDIELRAQAVQIGLGMLSQSSKEVISHEMTMVINTYYDLGEALEAKLATIRLCIFLSSGSTSISPQLWEILDDLKRRCILDGDYLILGEAQLLLAELEFRTALQKKAPPDFESLAQVFETALSFFQQGNHAFGDAKVGYRWGNLLLQYGISEGVKIVESAIQGFEEFDEISTRQSAWRSLNVWHVRHGAPEKARRAFDAAERLSIEAGIALSRTINWLAKADDKLRQGRIAEAREILLSAISARKPHFLSASSVAILANVLGAVGLKEEAVRYLREVIVKLSDHGQSTVLSQLWFILANQYSTSEPLEGIQCLKAAIKIDRQIGDKIGEAQHLYTKAWFWVQHLRVSGQTIVIDDKIKTDFDKAETLLQEDRRLEAREVLASMLQQRAQIELFAGNYKVCADWYTKAELIYRRLQLLPGLAFTLSHQGLVLIEVARRVRELAYYAKANDLFMESQELFKKAGIGSMLWRVVFFQAICSYESGKNIAMSSEEQQALWQQANNYFEQAKELVRQLRGVSSYDNNTLQQQSTGIAFGIDKQVLYLTGFQFYFYFMKDLKKALEWLEHMKTRVMQDLLADNFSPPPSIAHTDLVIEEKRLRELKKEVLSIEESFHIQSQIDELLVKMEKEEGLQKYSLVRCGKAIKFSIIQQLLQ